MKTRKIIEDLEKLKEELNVVYMDQVPNAIHKFLDIETHQVTLANGKTFNREKLTKNNRDGSAVVIVPVTLENETFVIVQPRVFTKNGIGVEIPAGYIDPGETPMMAAKRELREEIGCESQELIPLKSYYQDQGISAAYNTCFLALGCIEKYPQKLDCDEYIKYMKCSLDDLYYLLDTGIINDANGIIAIEEARKILKRKN